MSFVLSFHLFFIIHPAFFSFLPVIIMKLHDGTYRNVSLRFFARFSFTTYNIFFIQIVRLCFHTLIPFSLFAHARRQAQKELTCL